MEFQRSGAERRRRVFMDDQHAPADDASAETPSRTRKQGPTAPAHAKTAYAEAAQNHRQPRITDLIPKRAWSVTVLALSGFTAVAGVLLLYTHVFRARSLLTVEAMSGLDLDSRASLATWLSSAVLAVAAGGAVVVYMVRRHKQDDYRGHYRWWLWTAAALLLASMDATAGLHRMLPPLLRHVTGKSLYGDGSIWWMVIVGGLLGTLVIRIGLEIRRCRGSLVMLGLAIAGYTTAGALTLGMLPLVDSGLLILATAGCLLTAHVLLGLTVALYARYVYLDAHGKLAVVPPRPAKEQSKPDAKKGGKGDTRRETGVNSPEANNGDNVKRVDPAHEPPQKNHQQNHQPEPERGLRPQSAAQATSSAPAKKPLFFKPTQPDDEEDDEDTSSGRPLSKAERKRLRKERREPVAD